MFNIELVLPHVDRERGSRIEQRRFILESKRSRGLRNWKLQKSAPALRRAVESFWGLSKTGCALKGMAPHWKIIAWQATVTWRGAFSSVHIFIH